MCALTLASGSAGAVDYYVAPASGQGSDGNDGKSLGTPFLTIQRAVHAAGAGDVVNVRGGTYRESVDAMTGGESEEKPLTVQAYAKEVPVIKGSDVVTNWTLYKGSIWVKNDWAFRSQQVFVDFDAKAGKSLQQIGMPSSFYHIADHEREYPNPVGKGLEDMVPGSFFQSDTALYVWLADGSDPNNHVMEASTRSFLFSMHKPFVDLKGLSFRHSNSSAVTQQGAAVGLSGGSRVEDCDIEWCDFAGVGMAYQGDGSQAVDCIISNNGAVGLEASESSRFLVKGCTISNNNNRNFNRLWHAGGIKITTRSYGTIENNEISYNNGSGVWFDYADSIEPKIVRCNYIHDNGPTDAGVMAECSRSVLVCNNLIVDNERRGIYISASDGSKIYNNTIVGTKGRAAIDEDGIPRPGKTLKNNSILNNVIYNTSASYDVLMRRNGDKDIDGNTCDYNCYFRSAGTVQLYFHSGTKAATYSTLPEWQKVTGYDSHSFVADPGFLNLDAKDYHISGKSSLIKEGTPVPDVSTDYAGAPRGQGSNDMGAYEAHLTSTNTVNP